MPLSADDQDPAHVAADPLPRELIEIHSLAREQDQQALKRPIAALGSNQSEENRWLRERIRELEDQLSEYEGLMAELPDLFERKFQQRLEPLLERYRVLAEASTPRTASNPILLRGRNVPGLPSFFRRRRPIDHNSPDQNSPDQINSENSRSEDKTDRRAA